MLSKTVITSVPCKHCSAPVMVKKENVYEHAHLNGGIVSSACYKCHKTSTFSYEIKDWQFILIR